MAKLTALSNDNGTLSSPRKKEIFGIPIGAPTTLESELLSREPSEAQTRRMLRQQIRDECPANANAYVLGDVEEGWVERTEPVYLRDSMDRITEMVEEDNEFAGYRFTAAVQYYRI